MFLDAISVIDNLSNNFSVLGAQYQAPDEFTDRTQTIEFQKMDKKPGYYSIWEFFMAIMPIIIKPFIHSGKHWIFLLELIIKSFNVLPILL